MSICSTLFLYYSVLALKKVINFKIPNTNNHYLFFILNIYFPACIWFFFCKAKLKSFIIPWGFFICYVGYITRTRKDKSHTQQNLQGSELKCRPSFAQWMKLCLRYARSVFRYVYLVIFLQSVFDVFASTPAC